VEVSFRSLLLLFNYSSHFSLLLLLCSSSSIVTTNIPGTGYVEGTSYNFVIATDHSAGYGMVWKVGKWVYVQLAIVWYATLSIIVYIYINIFSSSSSLSHLLFCILHLALAGADTQANSGGAGATGLRQTSKTVTWTATAAASIDAHALCGQGGGSGTAIMYKAKLTVTKHAVSSKCGGNTATAAGLDIASTPAGTFQFACGTGYSLKANPDTIAAPDAATNAIDTKTTCCDQVSAASSTSDVAGKCGGNAASATGLDEASTPAGAFQFACGTGYSLKATPDTIAASVAATDAGATKTTCCDQDTAGKCGGNTVTATNLAEASSGGTETFQFACGTGFTLKASPEGITPADASDAAATKTECCDAELPTCTKSDNTAMTAKCDCGGAGNECDAGKYCYDKTATTTVCERQPKPAACLTDGKVTPFVKDQKMYFESCQCTDAKECTLGSVCDTNGATDDALCKCTPSDTQWCMQSKTKEVRGTDTAVLFGCFKIGGKYII
jgi:hypothetical protein